MEPKVFKIEIRETGDKPYSERVSYEIQMPLTDTQVKKLISQISALINEEV